MRRRGVMSNQKMFLAVLSVVIGLDNVVTLANLVTLAMKMGYSEDVVETAILNAFTRVRNLDMALRYFGNLPSTLWTTMISTLPQCAGYMRNGMVDKATELFKQMTTRNVACWAAMIYGLMHNGQCGISGVDGSDAYTREHSKRFELNKCSFGMCKHWRR
ncbi:hypothetical protein BC332_25481 [Capsicum chinense]|nr:hypothetical protein BC332_25481 [Capsicum chinense]